MSSGLAMRLATNENRNTRGHPIGTPISRRTVNETRNVLTTTEAIMISVCTRSTLESSSRGPGAVGKFSVQTGVRVQARDHEVDEEQGEDQDHEAGDVEPCRLLRHLSVGRRGVQKTCVETQETPEADCFGSHPRSVAGQ